MTGYSRGELMGMSTAQLSEPEDNPGADHNNELMRQGQLRSYSGKNASGARTAISSGWT